MWLLIHAKINVDVSKRGTGKLVETAIYNHSHNL